MLLNLIVPVVFTLCAVVPTGSFIPPVPDPCKDVAVTTPAMLTLSKFVCPSTSKSPFKSIAAAVAIPVTTIPGVVSKFPSNS